MNQSEVEIELRLDNYCPGTLELNKYTPEPVYGFQFELQGAVLIGCNCPYFDMVQWNGNTVFGISLAHVPIPPEVEKMLEIDYINANRIVRVMNLVLSDANGFEYQNTGRLFTMPPTTALDPSGHEVSGNDTQRVVSAGTVPQRPAR